MKDESAFHHLLTGNLPVSDQCSGQSVWSGASLEWTLVVGNRFSGDESKEEWKSRRAAKIWSYMSGVIRAIIQVTIIGRTPHRDHGVIRVVRPSCFAYVVKSLTQTNPHSPSTDTCLRKRQHLSTQPCFCQQLAATIVTPHPSLIPQTLSTPFSQSSLIRAPLI